MHPLETCLRSCSEIHASGAAVPETSYYPALETLLNEVGRHLKPRVRCIINLQNQGAGLPDGGLFTADQFRRSAATDPLPGASPARGAIEAKSTSDDATLTARGEQVRRYLRHYGLVLVTNYRDFVLVSRDAAGQPTILESYRLADSEPAFWSAAAQPRKTSAAHGERFIEYLKRVMLQAAPLAEPKELAWFLASYARDARVRVEQANLPALAEVRKALEEALGITFEGEKGEHFFRSTLVQTLFYGLFSAWVLWSRKLPAGDSGSRFDWRMAAWELHVPMIQALFQQVAMPSRLGPLGLVEVLDWTGAALNRVDRPSFFARFEEEHAVQYFYEPFLEAFDPQLRKDLGVWYTPREIVQYMVARVDTVLREELGLPDGLADERVFVLDPCCGTGTYLIEVLKRIDATLKERGADALRAQDLKRAAMGRVFGFEILPAPFVVAHLQLGLLLRNLGAPLREDTSERVGVYLTNALTGWEPPEGPKRRLPFPELEQERDAAERVKRETPILVVLGNPPYNAYAGVSPKEEHGLVDLYKSGLARKWGIKKFNLDDLYVRFFRLAERRIAEGIGKGVVCYISNFSYLSDPSFVVMRQRFLAEFDQVWIDCLNGDSRETGKLTPDGKPDPSVFSTDYNREGIRVGTAIGLLVRRPNRLEQPIVHFRQFWGANKRIELLESLTATDSGGQNQRALPEASNRFSFRPLAVQTGYRRWPSTVDLCQEAPISGLQEMRRGALIDIERGALKERMRAYYDPAVTWQQLKAFDGRLTEDAGRFQAEVARARIQAGETFDSTHVVQYSLYPFDARWCYHTNTRPLWNEPRPALAAQNWHGNAFIVVRMVAERPNENVPIFTTAHLPDYHLLRPNAVAIPIRVVPRGKQRNGDQQPRLLSVSAELRANLSVRVRRYLEVLRVGDPDAEAEIAGLIWMHALAIGYSPRYLSENADEIRQDWPRIPLPASRAALLASAALGRQIAAMLDSEQSLAGVTTGSVRPELSEIGAYSTSDGSPPELPRDLEVTAGWGHGGSGVVMGGAGKLVRRDYRAEERQAIEEGAVARGLTAEQAHERLGDSTLDVYLNDRAYWRNVPARVWEYRIGGYQVMKKWLSYRERPLLGRALTLDEVREVTHMARRLCAILLLEPALDANYQAVKADTYTWPSEGAP